MCPSDPLQSAIFSPVGSVSFCLFNIHFSKSQVLGWASVARREGHDSHRFAIAMAANSNQLCQAKACGVAVLLIRHALHFAALVAWNAREKCWS